MPLVIFIKRSAPSDTGTQFQRTVETVLPVLIVSVVGACMQASHLFSASLMLAPATARFWSRSSMCTRALDKNDWHSFTCIWKDLGRQSAQFAQKAVCLVRAALRSPNPPRTRGSDCVLVFGMLSNQHMHLHRLASWASANLATVSGGNVLKRCVVQAVAQCNKERPSVFSRDRPNGQAQIPGVPEVFPTF